ncbi:MAG: hypothetical protein EAZ95_07535 [Bacteroidetes bacterium]|nr:MAG: hypothetical protein EAZ95_07535 [Bacteroidota bacterium]
MRYFILLACLLASCDDMPMMQSGNDSMRQDVSKVVAHYCKGQNVQLEIAQKMAEYKAKGQLPTEELNAQMDASNQHMEAYAQSLDSLMKKYKGKERSVHNLLKKGQLNCK